ncbi:MAG: cell division protein FtsA [Nitrospinae bacterium]|nr:cell division protein FtsA [Nitrospinota bacterium]
MKNIKSTRALESAIVEGLSEREKNEREKALAATRKRLGKFNQPNQFLGSRNAIGCVSVEISQRCNLSCSLCYLSENSNDVIDLPLSKVFERLESVRRNFGVGTNVQISGGDPTLRDRKELVQIVRYARTLGLNPSLLTNGILCSRDLLVELSENRGAIFHYNSHVSRILTEDEKDLGVCMVDIGGGTTDIAVFTEGAIRHTAVIPVAGDQVTNDIAMALRTPTPHAEDIKIKYACALASLAGENETIKVPSVGDRSDRDLSRQALAEVVEPRYDELFTLVQAELRRSGYEDLIAAGIVLTGGTSKIEGAVDLAEEIFHMPVSLGKPKNVSGLSDIVRNPIYSTAVGLLQHGALQIGDQLALPAAAGMDSMMGRVKNWIMGNY